MGVRGLAPPPKRAARPGQGGVTRRPGPPRRPAPPSRASWRLRVRRLFVLRRWGPGRPRHPSPGSRERPRESPRPRRAPEPAAPAPQRPLQALSPRPTAPPGVARLPCARAPGCFPFPSLWPWPPRLRRLLLRRRRSEQAGGRMDGAGGPGEYGEGRAACPFPERRPVGRCHCSTAVRGVPACSSAPGALSILHCFSGRSP